MPATQASPEQRPRDSGRGDHQREHRPTSSEAASVARSADLLAKGQPPAEDANAADVLREHQAAVAALDPPASRRRRSGTFCRQR
jgi:protein tyrosine phosphatase (PTP) superfamily phosphohydrolase (DUF442 family)